MGCGLSKASPYDGLPLLTIRNVIDYPSSTANVEEFVLVAGIAIPEKSKTIIRSPLIQTNTPTDLATDTGLIFKTTVKKQAGSSSSNARQFTKAFEHFAAVTHFRITDIQDSSSYILVRITKKAAYSLAFRSKIYNIEYNTQTDQLQGGGEPGTRANILPMPVAASNWYRKVAGSFDGLETIQSAEAKFGYAFQRAIWNRSLKSNDKVLIKGKVVEATPNEKEMHGATIVVVELGDGCALSNVEKDLTKYVCVQNKDNNNTNQRAPQEEDECDTDTGVLDTSLSPVQWIKTNMKSYK